jgi:hypothetical protein
MQISGERWLELFNDVATIKRLLEGNGTPGLVAQLGEVKKDVADLQDFHKEYRRNTSLLLMGFTLLLHGGTEAFKALLVSLGISKGH